MQTFTVSVQHAHHQHDEMDNLGTLVPEQVLDAYDQMNWEQEASQAQELQRVSPTFSVQRGDELLWVSVCGVAPNIEFVSDYSYRGEVRRLFGLLKYQGTISKDRQDLKPAQARQAIAAFVAEDRE